MEFSLCSLLIAASTHSLTRATAIAADADAGDRRDDAPQLNFVKTKNRTICSLLDTLHITIISNLLETN